MHNRARGAAGVIATAMLLQTLGCADGMAPTEDRLSRVEVYPRPAELVLAVAAEPVPLTLVALDGSGRLLPLAGAIVTYSSSAPDIASVVGGTVTGHTPGAARITVTVTLGKQTRSASTTAEVRASGNPTPTGTVPPPPPPPADTVAPQPPPTGQYPVIGGTYDLVGVITNSDPAWGIENGTRQATAITIARVTGTGNLTGTFTRLVVTDPAGNQQSGGVGGTVSGSVGVDGSVILELTFAGSGGSYLYGWGALAADGSIQGRYGAGGHISGTFTAVRR